MVRRSIPLLFLLAAGCADNGATGDLPPPGPDQEPAVETPPLPPAGDVTAPGGTGTPPAPAAITGNAAGCIRIGASPAEVRAACGEVRDTAIELEGMRQDALAAEVGGASALAEIVDGRVWRITVEEPGPVTADGIGVGTPARRVADYEGARVNTGEGRYFVTVPGLCGLSFGIQGVPFDAAPPTVEALSAAPDSVRVGEVLVIGGC